MYLSRTIWVFWFKLFHIMPMPYHWFKNKWKTLILIICIKLLVQTILLLVQRDYIKTTLKILSTKITTIVRLVDVNIIWVLKFGTKFEFQSLKQGQKVWHYWLKNKMKIIRAQVNERLTEFKKKNKK